MQIDTPFRCLIVGEGTLPIQCAELILARGHTISGVISPDSALRRWAEQRAIPQRAPGAGLGAFAEMQPCDYLFSIVNSTVLPRAVLELPRIAAINYHDGPLPRYAGVHATSWALLRGERDHGVTWHIMAEQVDAGAILKQRLVAIFPDDTAMSLNLKCYDAAMEAFGDLLDDLDGGLDGGLLKPQPQDLGRRSYFSLHQRPAAGCALPWRQPAEQISALVRALQFGPYPNPLGLPKLLMGDDFVIVSEIQVLGTASAVTPGTITGIEEQRITVATGSNDVAILGLQTSAGQPLAVDEYVARWNLRGGYRFEQPDEERARRVGTLHERICRFERFWHPRLAAIQPLPPPYGKRLDGVLLPDAGPFLRHTMWLAPEIAAFFAESQTSSSDSLLAAFAAYLALVSGNSSFDIGFRSTELDQQLAGLQPFFADAVPLQVEHNRGWNFGQLRRALAEQLTLVRRHLTYLADLPARHGELRAKLALRARSLPIAVAMVERLDTSSAVPGSELTLLIATDGRACAWLYDPRLLDAADVERMADQWGCLLAAIVAEPNRPLELLPLISAAERHQQLVTWNDTSAPYPANRCVHQLFEAQVERSPAGTALLAGDSEMSYAALNRRANQLAHHLRLLGIGPDRLVAVCLQRSPELIISLLAILKAGGAYLPLDPSYPRERLAFMLADAQVPILIAGQDFEQNDLPIGTLLLQLEAEWAAVARQPTENPAVELHPDNLAYVIYTSGSTGRPKGSMIPHRGLVNYLAWCIAAYPLAEGRGSPLHTSIGFDLSVTSLWAPLLAGRSLLLLPEDQWSLSLAAALLREGNWSLLKLTPAHLELLREQLPPSEVAGRARSLVIGGEALYGETLAFWRQHAPDTRLFNEYGPTETVVGCCVYELPADAATSGPVPIGRPIANTQLYLLDRLLQPVPVGMPGELYIGGVGVCRGYLNRPELTAERFIPDPFAATAGARLYRSGDLARYRPDGTLEYLGRSDQQVKIRGFRIELGEVEAALLEHPAVADAVVLAEAAAQRLIAYVVPAATEHNSMETSPSLGPYPASLPTRLRRFLQDRLPTYMLPAAYVLLKELPLTVNGKVNRRALPPPDAAALAESGGSEAPHSEHERQLAQLWATLLGVSRVGIHDNFFELGGHSLLATRLVSQLRNTFGVELSLRSLFETPTVAALAERLAALEWATSQGPPPGGGDREEGEL